LGSEVALPAIAALASGAAGQLIRNRRPIILPEPVDETGKRAVFGHCKGVALLAQFARLAERLGAAAVRCHLKSARMNANDGVMPMQRKKDGQWRSEMEKVGYKRLERESFLGLVDRAKTGVIFRKASEGEFATIGVTVDIFLHKWVIYRPAFVARAETEKLIVGCV
jgi:hypothetical protein